jgi:hypothetical protein
MRLTSFLLLAILCSPGRAGEPPRPSPPPGGATKGEPRVHAHKLRIAGIVVTSMGLSLVVGGAVVSAVPALYSGPLGCAATDWSCWPGVRWSGVALLGLGAGLVSVGAPLWVMGRHYERTASARLVLSLGVGASGAITTGLAGRF